MQGLATLVRQASSGDRRAWEALVVHYGPLLRKIAYRFRLSQEQADDAAQITWMRLVENIDRIRDPEKLGAWLSITMRRECIELVTNPPGEQLTDDRAGKVFGHSASPDISVLLAERNALLWSAVERLPARERRVLLALAVDPPPSYEQVGAALSIPVGTIGPTRQRALRRLRMLLNEAEKRQSASSRHCCTEVFNMIIRHVRCDCGLPVVTEGRHTELGKIR